MLGPMTMKDAEVLISRIKERYPHPLACGFTIDGTSPSCGYCVGGAYIAFKDTGYASLKRKFPYPDALACTLRKDNPELCDHIADDYASMITGNNDDGAFDKAYETLLEALTYRPKEMTDGDGPVDAEGCRGVDRPD